MQTCKICTLNVGLVVKRKIILLAELRNKKCKDTSQCLIGKWIKKNGLLFTNYTDTFGQCMATFTELRAEF